MGLRPRALGDGSRDVPVRESEAGGMAKKGSNGRVTGAWETTAPGCLPSVRVGRVVRYAPLGGEGPAFALMREIPAMIGCLMNWQPGEHHSAEDGNREKCSWEQSVASCLHPRAQVAAKPRCERSPWEGVHAGDPHLAFPQVGTRMKRQSPDSWQQTPDVRTHIGSLPPSGREWAAQWQGTPGMSTRVGSPLPRSKAWSRAN